MQRVCATGGVSKGDAALGYGFSGVASGLGTGLTLGGGWGALIGAGVGAAAGIANGYMTGGEKDFCQEIESCEDIDVSGVDGGCKGD